MIVPPEVRQRVRAIYDRYFLAREQDGLWELPDVDTIAGDLRFLLGLVGGHRFQPHPDDAIPCRSCSQVILLAQGFEGRIYPYNAEPDPRGSHSMAPILDGDGEPTGRWIARYTPRETRPLFEGALYKAHTCEMANRRKSS